MPREGHEDSGREDSARRRASAWDVALQLLGVRARSRSEMCERLARRGFSEDEVETTMARLDKHALLDDEAFAREWVQSRGEHSRRGSVGLRHELRAKGIDDAVVAAVLTEVDPDDEYRRASELVARKLASSTADLSDRSVRDSLTRRLSGMLLRRGFPSGLVRDVVDEQLREHAAAG
ncbi:MAG TPA: regulatory protein RecX [Gordonia sp. (in: high G+C Gram-positive bacteria)]|uniref:regulatory protein RecX n=1 Tax=unclassified Gordonia (in: high G+C Gram-positive bacteria) TaxID=2657482 RepID=UPI000F9971AB|nr:MULTISPECIES: regulatory protein RecX [unclassified Gordonia (in: high G+C Gram-positive bacteria)]RUP38534.1 MAG: regulatory protein RecX [Gordonia sp. (in: high G+C Gram-positive bacteria)]HNP58573.1 regulatory protein RecX [Gordonia sp. (in: high G+C Gram-positive bacteria)]HRC52207.1 regulatory protein RecX [Gordonia sp. (in: high G+C Gram-positive bacteria)]